MDLCTVNTVCKTYNTWLAFVQNHARAIEGSAVIESGAAFENNVREIQDILEDTKERLEQMRAQLQKQLGSVHEHDNAGFG